MANVKELTSLPMDEILSAAHNRPDRRRISVSPILISTNGQTDQGNDDDDCLMILSMVVR
ncbi:hypothetical protein DPMN_191567 [Dreissena polymorpha]|uniref:Uncharacterized protein n=1 Tax=Dreissena polymorpha TaxID=45954 RepID=A0A9D3Y389_DREPO|nr:hypothetical protein DPMN_191567 [Dreissena polymorpha]